MKTGTQNKEKESDHFGKTTLKAITKHPKVILGVIGVLLISVLAFGISRSMTKTEPVTSRLEFHNLGTLTTQEVLIIQVDVLETKRDIYGISIPFTTSKAIYAYDVILKAGIDFANVKYEEKQVTTDDGTKKQYVITVPQAEITDCYINNESFQLFEEKESIFTNISMKLQNEKRIQLEKDAKEKAINDGFLERASAQAEVLLEEYVKQLEPDCEVKFVKPKNQQQFLSAYLTKTKAEEI